MKTVRMKSIRIKRDSKSELFLEWLAQNRARFDHRLHLRRDGDNLIARYHGIIPELRVLINENRILVTIEYHGTCWDSLIDFDFLPDRDADGRFFCRMCEVEKHVRYSSIEEMYRIHSFDEFLAWSNKRIRDEHFLVLEGVSSSTAARIVMPEDLHRWNESQGLVGILSLRARMDS